MRHLTIMHKGLTMRFVGIVAERITGDGQWEAQTMTFEVVSIPDDAVDERVLTLVAQALRIGVTLKMNRYAIVTNWGYRVDEQGRHIATITAKSWIEPPAE